MHDRHGGKFFNRFRLSDRQIAELQRADRMTSPTPNERVMARAAALRAGARNDTILYENGIQQDSNIQVDASLQQRSTSERGPSENVEQNNKLLAGHLSFPNYNQKSDKRRRLPPGNSLKAMKGNSQGSMTLTSSMEVQNSANDFQKRLPVISKSITPGRAVLLQPIAPIPPGSSSRVLEIGTKQKQGNDLITSYSDSSTNSSREVSPKKFLGITKPEFSGKGRRLESRIMNHRSNEREDWMGGDSFRAFNAQRSKSDNFVEAFPKASTEKNPILDLCAASNIGSEISGVRTANTKKLKPNKVRTTSNGRQNTPGEVLLGDRVFNAHTDPVVRKLYKSNPELDARADLLINGCEGITHRTTNSNDHAFRNAGKNEDSTLLAMDSVATRPKSQASQRKFVSSNKSRTNESRVNLPTKLLRPNETDLQSVNSIDKKGMVPLDDLLNSNLKLQCEVWAKERTQPFDCNVGEYETSQPVGTHAKHLKSMEWDDGQTPNELAIKKRETRPRMNHKQRYERSMKTTGTKVGTSPNSESCERMEDKNDHWAQTPKTSDDAKMSDLRFDDKLKNYSQLANEQLTDCPLTEKHSKDNSKSDFSNQGTKEIEETRKECAAGEVNEGDEDFTAVHEKLKKLTISTDKTCPSDNFERNQARHQKQTSDKNADYCEQGTIRRGKSTLKTRSHNWMPAARRIGKICVILGVCTGFIFLSTWFVACGSLAFVDETLEQTS